MEHKTIANLVREKEQQFTSGTPTIISKYVNFDLNENNNKIDAYLNSKHISGDTDSQGREKPFFNIVLATRNIWYRSTDIDRKNIRIRSTNRDQVIPAFLLNILLQEWMRKSRFGTFLNDWGLALSTYGSSVPKFVERNGELIPSVTPWNRMIVDNVDVDNDLKIEKLFYTPAQLRRNKSYDQEFVKDLIEAKTERRLLGRGRKVDNKSDYIEVYEVHGEMQLSHLTDKWDEDSKDTEEYVQQMHVVSFTESKEKHGDWNEYTLYRGREAKDPYMQTHLIKEDGRATGIGAIESLFEAQWMVNHSQKAIKDQLDVVSKVIFQTADPAFIGRNVLTNIENGDIFNHAPNAPLTQVANNSHDITSIQNFQTTWEVIGNKITGVSESMMGVTPPSGTAYRQTSMLLQESHSLFELMTENKGLYLEDMLRTYVLPFLKRKLNHSKEISALLDSQGIKEIDSMYVPNEASRRYNNKSFDQLMNGEIPSPYNQQEAEGEIRKELAPLGNQRFLKPSEIPDRTWKDVLANLEEEIEIEITGENTEKQATLDSLNTTFQTIASLAGRPMSPEEKFVFGKILEENGRISPLEMGQLQTQQSTQPQQPMAGMPQGIPSPMAGSNAGQLQAVNQPIQ
jgi:hypothetical protein